MSIETLFRRPILNLQGCKNIFIVYTIYYKNMVKVEKMEIGKKYNVNGDSLKLISKEKNGAGGSGLQEPTFKLNFE